MRLYAEDPARDFRPSTGVLTRARFPDDVRVDGWVEGGTEITPFYDPLLAKLIVHAENRAACLALMERAIADFHIEGVATTLPFGRFVVRHGAFASGDFDTGFVAAHYGEEARAEAAERDARAAATIALRAYLDTSGRLTLPQT